MCLLVKRSDQSERNKIETGTDSFVMLAVLSISFEVNGCTRQVGGRLLFERQRREPPRGVWGHAPPENFEI